MSTWSRRNAVAVAGLFLPLAHISSLVAQATSGISPQQVLDALARPLPADSRVGLPASFPALYQDWTEAQKQTGQQIILQRCGFLYAMTGDNPKAHLLPETMSNREAAELAMDVCLPSKLPADWPERQKRVAEAEVLIRRANAQGAGLRLPNNLRETK